MDFRTRICGACLSNQCKNGIFIRILECHMTFRRKCAHIAGMPVKVNINNVAVHGIEQTEYLCPVSGTRPDHR
ncbi:hypothetical protein D3C73_803190 [compost metagenome]